MHKIDHSTAQEGRFVDGNPAAGTPATVLTSKWANSTQEEIINVITSRGIKLDTTPDKSQNNQLLLAINDILQKKDLSFAVANNQANTLMGSSFEFSLATCAAVVIKYCIYRKDATQEKMSIGKVKLFGLPNQSKFVVINESESNDDGAQVSFDITMAEAIGKLKYSSSNFAGANYEGKMTYEVTIYKK